MLPKRLAAIIAFSSVVALSGPGCEIITNSQHGGGAPEDVCGAMCDRLLACHAIRVEGLGDCLSGCDDRLASEPQKTAAGCQCVTADVCRPLGGYHCPGAPLPSGAGTGGSGSSSSSSSGSSSSSSSSGALGSCSDNHDCAVDQDCIQGACLVRCTASCECAKAESCVAGYCRTAMPPPVSCKVSCDCPKGMSCVAGACH